MATHPLLFYQAENTAYWPPGPGKIQRTVHEKLEESFTAADFNVVGDGSTNNLVTLANALMTASGKRLLLGDGTFVIDAANPAITMADFTTLEGAGRGRTIIEFRNLGNTSNGITATNKTGVTIKNLTIKAQTALSANQLAVLFYECNDCLLDNVEQYNFSQGFTFDAGTAPTLPTVTWGKNNKAINCLSSGSRSYGFFAQAQSGHEWLGCTATGATNQDGFKTGRGTRAGRIIGCHSYNNNQDGFDTYDGFIGGVISDCIAEYNGDAGFQIKGAFGGSWSANDYVSRDSAISNCVAKGNLTNGFLFQETRNLVISNLIALENTGFGFCFNNIQGCAITNIHALRNTQEGVNVQGSSSRNRFVNVVAEDNSYVDGTVQNGTYHGINILTSGVNFFTGVLSLNGTQSGKQGGQGYGIFVGTSTAVAFSDYWCVANITGDVGGTNPYAGNTFGTTLGSMKIRRGTGSPEGVVTGAIGDLWLNTTGGALTTMYVKESGAGNTGWVAK